MNAIRAMMIRWIIWLAQLLSPKGAYVLVLSDQSLRVHNKAHEIEARLHTLESKSANWDHAFDYLSSLATRMTSFERTSTSASDAAQYIRDFRLRLENMAYEGQRRSSASTKESRHEIASPTREVSQNSAVLADRNLTT